MCLPSYLTTYLHTPTYLPTYLLTYTLQLTYLPTYPLQLTYLPTYPLQLTYLPTYLRFNLPIYLHSDSPTYRCSFILVYTYAAPPNNAPTDLATDLILHQPDILVAERTAFACSAYLSPSKPIPALLLRSVILQRTNKKIRHNSYSISLARPTVCYLLFCEEVTVTKARCKQ